MSRRSRPPRNRKSRNPEAPRHDVAVVMPPADGSVEGFVREATSPSIAPPSDELAELDAGWD